VLADVYWTLLQPSTIIVGLLLLSWGALELRSWRFGRMLLTCAVLLAAVPTVLPVAAWLALPLETHITSPELPERVSGILILGGAVRTPVTVGNQQLSLNDRAERLLAGAHLARQYPLARVVITGDAASTFLDVNALGMFDGIDTRRLEFVANSRSTYEDALFSIAQVQPARGETWLMVTSALHMPRAVGVFTAQGWQVIAYPVDRRYADLPPPSLAVAERLNALDEVVREWGALLIYYQQERTHSLLP
jgi:uncharacterized SAM-binding protein YcdF (DUF218 family)